MRAGACHQLIFGRLAALGGSELLKRRFRVVRSAALARQVGFPKIEDELLGSFDATVDEQRSDQRLDHVAYDIVALVGTVLSSLLAKANESRDANFATVRGAGFTVD